MKDSLAVLLHDNKDGYKSFASVSNSMNGGFSLEFKSQFEKARNPKELRTNCRMYITSAKQVDDLVALLLDAKGNML